MTRQIRILLGFMFIPPVPKEEDSDKIGALRLYYLDEISASTEHRAAIHDLNELIIDESVDAHGGDIQANNPPNGGLEVEFRLPAGSCDLEE